MAKYLIWDVIFSKPAVDFDIFQNRSWSVKLAKGCKSIFHILEWTIFVGQNDKITNKATVFVLNPLIHFYKTKFLSISHWVTESEKFVKKAKICCPQPYIYRYDTKLASISYWIAATFLILIGISLKTALDLEIIQNRGC